MNKINWKFFKFTVLIFVIFVSGLALCIHRESADFDPIKEDSTIKIRKQKGLCAGYSQIFQRK